MLQGLGNVEGLISCWGEGKATVLPAPNGAMVCALLALSNETKALCWLAKGAATTGGGTAGCLQ